MENKVTKGNTAHNDVTEDVKKKLSIKYYVLIMLLFSIPLLIVGYFITKNGNSYMLMPLMFVLVFGMRSIDDYIRA